MSRFALICTLLVALQLTQGSVYAINPIQSQTVLKSDPAFCHGLDCPRFKVVDKTEDYEVRYYEKTVWASTVVESYAYALAVPEGFKRLFSYIDGGNEDAVKIPMTSPVRVEVHPSQGPFCKSNFTVSFYVPEDFQKDTPEPSDSKVFITSETPFTAFVAHAGGFVMDDFTLSHMADKLIKALDADEQEYEDFFYFAGYDPPFRLTKRHNEIWIRAIEDATKSS